MKPFPYYNQLDAKDCGTTCIRMISKFYGKQISYEYLKERTNISREGVSLYQLSDAAELIGFQTLAARTTVKQLIKDVPRPCILHWKQNHFVVCYDIKKTKKGASFKIADPATGKYVVNESELLQSWASSVIDGEKVGNVLMLNPTIGFYDIEESKFKKRSILNSFFIKYLTPYKKQILQVFLGLTITSLLQLIFPFLTQAIVDQGIGNLNLNFITLILIVQLVLFTTKLVIDFLRNWIILHVSSRIGIAITSDFLIKLMKLPFSFFDAKNIGEIMQRISDNSRIKTFLTGSSITTIFSFLNFIIFGAILAFYNLTILLVFLIGNILYISWIVLFMRSRRNLDRLRFQEAGKEQSCLIQFVNGMQDIKLNRSERYQRWKWERIQLSLFKVNIKQLSLSQYQQLGSVFFSQTTSLLISFIAAKNVIEGNITLGIMVSISYIIGQLSDPIEQVISFMQTAQDAKMSLERLNEIHNKEDDLKLIESKMTSIPENKDLEINNVSFTYDGDESHFVLNNINLVIPRNKVVAIVGTSGSGKTTLVKLLLGFYKPSKGTIKLGDVKLDDINPFLWRQHIGAVLQDGFIFSDTIANNIAVGQDTIDKERLVKAAEQANIRNFIETLPLKYNTIIGSEGVGLSQGQRQRILIARVIYNNPEFIFFDEATNSLDANNEKIITENLEQFYVDKTVIIVAHRLSTVRNADKIIVLENGVIVESGSHDELIKEKGAYYNLVKNQLELGN